MTENQKMDLILQKLGGIEGGLASVGEDVRSLQGDMQTIKGDVQTIKGDVQTLKEDVQTLKDRVTNIEITLENETNRNIQLIAEGHLNLDRKLDEALKELQPNTMYHLKVNHLDGEVTKMKRMLNMASTGYRYGMPQFSFHGSNFITISANKRGFCKAVTSCIAKSFLRFWPSI